MKRENITADEVRRLLHYDPLTGIFTRRVATGGRYRAKVGSVAGTVNDGGYILIALHSLQYRAHRLAVLYMTGEWPKHEVDHKNGVRTDNRWDNLRDVPPEQNMQNLRAAKKNSKSGVLGAYWSERDKVFISRINIPGGPYKHLGTFKTAAEAHQAYLAAKRIYHQACTI
jgi:hypothetical protein